MSQQALFDAPPPVSPLPAPERVKPLLKWAGGKSWLVPRLRDIYAPFRDTHALVEPFVGSAAVALGLQPTHAFLNDLSGPLVDFHLHVRSGAAWPALPANTSEAYYAARQRFNNRPPSIAERASLFYYLNHAGFNGLCRFNSRGEFNVPYGKRKTLTPMGDTSGLTQAMRHWGLTHGPWLPALLNLTGYESYFVYADPPYDGTFVGYTGAGFGWAEQVLLASTLAHFRGPVVASNAATPRILDLYRGLGFTVETLEAPRRISCNGDRANALEMLATMRTGVPA